MSAEPLWSEVRCDPDPGGLRNVKEFEAASLAYMKDLRVRFAESQSKLAAREKRMREVAEEMMRVGENNPPLWATAKNLPDAIRVWAAKLLEGLGGE